MYGTSCYWGLTITPSLAPIFQITFVSLVLNMPFSLLSISVLSLLTPQSPFTNFAGGPWVHTTGPCWPHPCSSAPVPSRICRQLTHPFSTSALSHQLHLFSQPPVPCTILMLSLHLLQFPVFPRYEDLKQHSRS